MVAQGVHYDELLVVLTQSGDRAAIERLARRWFPRLVRAANRLVGPDLAEDAAQDTLMAVLKGIGALRDPARFAPWAFGILHKRCVDLLRKSGPRSPDKAEIEVDTTSASPLDRIAISQAMAALPPDQRFAAHLFFIEGLTLAEIAEAQRVPVGTAKSRLFHARRQLKAALSGEDL